MRGSAVSPLWTARLVSAAHALSRGRLPDLAAAQTECLRSLALLGSLLTLLFQAGCTSLPTDYPRTVSTVLTDTADTRLGQASKHTLDGRTGVSAFQMLNRGTDAFLARLVLADAAEKSLDVQYYIWRGDTTGKVLLERVLRAADRGVRVRLLLDDVGAAANDSNLLAIDAHPNIDVRLFNPIAARSARLLGMLGDFQRANRRMHNKSFTADNQFTIVGGRNVGDEYFGARPDVAFADLDLLATGPIVDETSRHFDRYWNSPAAFPIAALSEQVPSVEVALRLREELRASTLSESGGDYARALKASGLAESLAAGNLPFYYGVARIVADDPAKTLQPTVDDSSRLLPQLLPEFEALSTELVLISPYFVPGEAGVARLRALGRRGVKVRVLTNSLASTDVPAVHGGYQKYRHALLDAGVELYELKPSATQQAPGIAPRTKADAGHGSLSGSSHASLHAKVMIFDRRALFVGSMNLDPRSAFTNTEIGAMAEQAELAGELAESLVRQLPDISFRLERVADEGTVSGSRIEWVATSGGAETRHTCDPMAGTWLRFKAWLLSLLPVEHLL